jgi:hypothetical protein
MQRTRDQHVAVQSGSLAGTCSTCARLLGQTRVTCTVVDPPRMMPLCTTACTSHTPHEAPPPPLRVAQVQCTWSVKYRYNARSFLPSLTPHSSFMELVQWGVGISTKECNIQVQRRYKYKYNEEYPNTPKYKYTQVQKHEVRCTLGAGVQLI